MRHLDAFLLPHRRTLALNLLPPLPPLPQQSPKNLVLFASLIAEAIRRFLDLAQSNWLAPSRMIYPSAWP